MSSSWQKVRLTSEGDGPRDPVGIDCFQTSGETPDPRVVVLAGIHGDELGACLAAHRLAQNDLPLLRGSMVVVPVCNEAAFQAASRVTPSDQKNLARVFPGRTDGSETERLAELLSRRVLSEADLLIDLHTAGRHYDMPLLVGCLDDGTDVAARSLRAARAFGVDTVWKHDAYSAGRTLSVVVESGAPAIYVESPGGDTVDVGTVRSYVLGVRSVLSDLNMLPESERIPAPHEVTVLTGSGNLDTNVIRCSHSGVFFPAVRVGSSIAKSGAVGVVEDLAGRIQEKIRAGKPGYVTMLRRTTAIQKDDVVACIADVDSGTA